MIQASHDTGRHILQLNKHWLTRMDEYAVRLIEVWAGFKFSYETREYSLSK